MQQINLYKIGGSLLRTGQAWSVMTRLIDKNQTQQSKPLFVMGGGELADAARELCARHKASEWTEHVMCLMAMDQNAQLALSCVQGLQPQASFDHMLKLDKPYTPGTWVDIASMICASSIEASNSITSDSLSLWLATQLADHARHHHLKVKIDVQIIKSCAVTRNMQHDAEALTQAAIVDAAFPRFAAKLSASDNVEWRVINYNEV